MKMSIHDMVEDIAKSIMHVFFLGILWMIKLRG